mgnify:FL=1
MVNVAAFLARAMSSVALDSRGQLLDIQNGIILCFFAWNFHVLGKTWVIVVLQEISKKG